MGIGQLLKWVLTQVRPKQASAPSWSLILGACWLLALAASDRRLGGRAAVVARNCGYMYCALVGGLRGPQRLRDDVTRWHQRPDSAWVLVVKIV
jgi:hypothetical protein